MMSPWKSSGLTDRALGSVAWAVFWSVINFLCLVLKWWYGSGARAREDKNPGGTSIKNVGFCENGAGYGGAIISLAAFLEKLPPQYQAVIYTSIGTEQYPRLRKFGLWRHVPPTKLLNCVWLKKYRIPFASLLDNIFNLVPYSFKYYLKFKRDKIHCVYLNNDASCNFAAAIAAKLAGLPLILHARGFNSDTKGNRWVLSKVDYCIAVSTAVKENLLLLGVASEKCTVVPEGLDLSIFYPREPKAGLRKTLEVRSDDAVITLIGGLVDWKGQDILLDAAPVIFDRFPKAVILLVGGAYGKDQRFATLIAERAASKGLRSRVRMLGARDDIADIVCCSDIIVHASTKPEPFGRTFLEGMALGKAVIASKEGGPLDVITDQVDGLLVEPRDPGKLADAINYLLANPTLANEMGTKAAQRARLYSIENHSNSLVSILKNIIEGQEQPVFQATAMFNRDA